MTNDNTSYHQLLIKFGEKQHMERLISHGEVHLKHVGHFTKLEQDEQRGDINEGVTSMWPLDGATISMKDENGELKEVGTVTSGTARERSQNLENANLYCLFYLELPINQTLNLSHQISENSWSGFGDSAVIIYDTPEFLNRLELSVKKEGYEISRKLIGYKDLSSHFGQLDPFIKDLQYSHQQEFRVLLWKLPPKDNPAAITLELGDLSDICALVSTKDFHKCEAKFSLDQAL